VAERAFELFDEYAAAYARGERPELGEFLARAGEDADELARLVDAFLARAPTPAPGSIVTVTRDGRRPLLVELQALVDRMRFGAPRRVAQGLDSQRVAMLLAVLNRHGGVSLQEHDVFVNLVGGLEVTETACDLPVALALVSSLADKAIAQSLVAFGEIGLTGELRPVAYGEERLREAAKQGFTTALVARDHAPRAPIDGLKVIAAGRSDEALKAALG
jgi:DNA repair protein RadA/Sms